jgi:Zn-dependent membrane protease YugP
MVSDPLLNSLSIDGWLMSKLMILGSLLLLFAVLLYAAIRAMRSAYIQEARRFSLCRMTGREVVGKLLQHLGLPTDRVEDGATIDHYNMWQRRIRLRTESSVASSVAALAIAAHEVGHAEQFAKGYWAARATRCLLVLLMLAAIPLLVYPYAATIALHREVNLTHLVALLAIVAVLRLPITSALELDATRRAKRLLSETSLAHETELDGISRLLRAAFHTHLALNAGLVLLMGAGVGAMWLVESGLSAPALTSMQLAARSEFQLTGPPPLMEPIHAGDLYTYPLVAFALTAFAFTAATVWWALSRRAQKAPAHSAVDANNEGMARYQAGDVAGAVALIEEALRQDPGLATAHYNLAIVYMSQGRNDEALASIEAMFASRTEDVEPLLGTADPWFIRGTLRLDRGDYLGAIDDLSRAYDLDPSDPAILLRNRSLAWIRLGQLDRALQDTNDVLALAPNDAVAYNNRGVIHRDLGHLEQAERDLLRSIELDPELPNPRQHLANLLDSKRTDAMPQSSV